MRLSVLAAVLAAATAAGLAGCGSASGGGSTAAAAGTTNACSHASIQKDLFQKGVLTVATDKPAYPPWF